MAHDVGGQGDDGRAGAAGGPLLGPDGAHGGRAVHARHLHIHQDQVPALATPGLDRLFAVVDDGQIDAQLMQQGLEHQLVDRIVLGRQHLQGGDGRAVVLFGDRDFDHGDRRRRDLLAALERQDDGEAGALTRLALDHDRATHQGRQVAADRQAQARAAEATRGRGVGLGEFLEQRLQLVGLDADAGVGDLQPQPPLPVQIGDDADLACLGELQGVGDQIVEDLAHAGGVTDPPAPRLRRCRQGEGQATLVGQGGEGRVGAFQQLVQIERLFLQDQLARLDLRQVQHIVQDGQ